MRVKALLGEKGPVPYMEIRDKMWMLGEDGLKDMRGTEAWKKLQDRDTKNESQHDPMGRFGSVVSNFIFHHEDYPPNMRFRLAHLALVRINTPSLEGKPLIQDLLVFPKSAGNSIVPLEDIISSTCGRNICEMPQLSSEYFEFADQWIKEHPLLDGP